MNYADVYREIRNGSVGNRLPCRIVDVMRAISRGARPMTAIRHPLGFICLPVARDGEYGICVHMWTGHTSTVELTTLPMHSHSWDLLSYVLYGEIRNQLAQSTAAGGSYQLGAGEFHLTVVTAQAATVALGRSQAGVLDLSLGNLSTPTHWVHRQRCARQETACLARALAERISASSRTNTW